jgi:hypothetical protein
MSTQEYIRSITEIIPDDFPTLTPLPESTNNVSTGLAGISWQTWIIIILVLALLGINVFYYLAKGTEEVATLFQQIFGPILKFFGYSTLTTAKQTVENTATGTKAGVDIVAGTATGALDTVEDVAKNVQGQQASSSLPVQNNIQQGGANMDKWQQDSLAKALQNSQQSVDYVTPDDSRSSIQTTGKSGWCYIGEEQGTRTCAEVGVNDMCMSGDVFPTQAVCMNPSLRA